MRTAVNFASDFFIGMRALAPIVFGAVLLFAHQADAVGLSPPEFDMGTIAVGSTASDTLRLQRGTDDVGTFFFEVSTYGECAGCIQGAEYIILPADSNAVTYDFTVAPTSNTAAGSYSRYIKFVIYTDTEDADGAQTTVSQGVTATVHFTVTAAPPVDDDDEDEPSSGGGGGGSGRFVRPGAEAEDDVADDTPVPTEDPAEDPTGTEPLVPDMGTDTDTDTDTEPDEPAMPTDASQDTPDDVSDTGEDTTTESGSSGGSFARGTESSGSSETGGFGTGGTIDAEPVSVTPAGEGVDGIAIYESFVSRTCDASCDVDGDGDVDFADAVSAMLSWDGEDVRPPATPPISALAPTEDSDEVAFSFELGSAVGEFDFVLANSHAATVDDALTFYLLVDTGRSGIAAADITLTFDTTTLGFLGVDTVGSIFPQTHLDMTEYDSGLLRFTAVRNSSFVGTRGYLASFQFRPRQEDTSGLRFERVTAYRENGSEITSIVSEDLFGRLIRSPQAQAINGQPQPNNEAPTEEWSCPCLKADWFLTCLTLLLLALGALGLLAYLVFIERDHERHS